MPTTTGEQLEVWSWILDNPGCLFNLSWLPFSCLENVELEHQNLASNHDSFAKLHFRFKVVHLSVLSTNVQTELEKLKSGWIKRIEKKRSKSSRKIKNKNLLSWGHHLPLALNQARLGLPSSAKHVNHVTRTTTLLQIPFFEAKLSQATSISNCPYACAVISTIQSVDTTSWDVSIFYDTV